MAKKKQKEGVEPRESPLFWPVKLKEGFISILDETKVPEKLEYIKAKDTKDAVKAIKEMKTRAFGQFLVVLNTFLLELNKTKKDSQEKVLKKLKQTARSLERSRPTFPFEEVTSIFIYWAKQAVKNKISIKKFVGKNILGYLDAIRARKIDRVIRIAQVINDGDCVLTHCNVSGELAMAAEICRLQNKDVHYFATETRPYFQGAKLTAWELNKMGVDVTLIADNAVGSVMADGLINKVIVGSDRSCANGDFANKIGTYQIAVVAKEFNIPFYVLIQTSDKIDRGQNIPIEIRDPEELIKFKNKKIIKGDIDGFYPAFDIIPNNLVTEPIEINVR